MLAAACLSLALLSASAEQKVWAENYEAARKEAVNQRKPLVVCIGAKWCPACPAAKRACAAIMKKRYAGKAVLVYLDYDAERELANRIRAYDVVPEIVIFSHVDGPAHVTDAAAQSEKVISWFVESAIKKIAAEGKQEKVQTGEVQ